MSPEDMSAFNDTMSWCNKNITGDVWRRYCNTNSTSTDDCDPYFLQNDVFYKPGIPGMFSGVAKSKFVC